MKNRIIIICFSLLLGNAAFAQTGQKNDLEEIKIKTSAVCEMCKKTIEDGLYTQKGIVSAVLDVPTKIVTVKYRSAKTNPEAIRTYISSLGYNADDVPANETAHDKLPGCCQKGSNGH